MTREEAKAEINKVFEPAFANYIITALAEGATPSERKAGKWKKRLVTTVPLTVYGYECPFCEFRTATNNFKFCPNCGECVKGVDE